MRTLLIIALAACGATPVHAVDFSPPLSSHAVLQSGVPYPIRGRGRPGERVEVLFQSQHVTATVDPRGAWTGWLEPLTPSANPDRLVARGSHTGEAILEDVLVGQVWLCAGQSNMAFELARAVHGRDAADASGELDAVRLLHHASSYPVDATPWSAAQRAAISPATFFDDAAWARCAPDTSGPFSAVGFFFGRYLSHALDMPVGLIAVPIGGTPTEAWVPIDAFVADPVLQSLDRDFPASPFAHRFINTRGQQNLVVDGPTALGHPFRPGFMHDSAIAPLAGVPVAGVLWYQGESNAHDAPRHERLLRLFTRSLREAFGNKTLPILMVQLPGIERDGWAELRESQVAVTDEPGVEIVTTLDLGHRTDVHPPDKRPVGERLARLALYTVHDIGWPGRPPRMTGFKVFGPRIEVVITDDGSGLRVAPGAAATFMVAGTDRVFHPATDVSVAGRGVLVLCDAVPAPVAVRYAWASDPAAAVYRIGDDMPLLPFRTDDWDTVTVAVVPALPVPPAAAPTESFESYPPGPIDELPGPAGTWRSERRAEISRRRATTGRQALRIFGGDAQSIVLEFDASPDAHTLAFAAERWTRRAPFEFIVATRRGGRWTPVYRDDGAAITIGGYNAQVECAIGAGVDALRLTCTSPEGGGILIDDLAIEGERPMRIVSVTAGQPAVPVLTGNAVNPVVRVHIVTEGGLDPISISSMRWTLASSVRLHDVEQVTTLTGLNEGVAFGAPKAPASAFTIDGAHELSRGDNVIWLSVSLTDQVFLDGSIEAACTEVTFSNDKRVVPGREHPDAPQRFGVALRRAGDDGALVYRIPGLVTTTAGTLIAVYDIRHDGGGDLPGNIDVGMNRSTDGGITWERMRTIMDMGDDPAWRHDGIGDPSILCDDETGTIWVGATWSHGNRSWNGSGPGLAPEETGQLMLTRSVDDGVTWSAPINITEQVKDPAWSFVLLSPGRGITMADGTLVFPAQYQDPPEENRTPHSTIIYSHDRGATWHIGRGARTNTTECQVVELQPGVLMLNMRDNRGGTRAVATTRDLGRTWTVHPSSRGALVEPVCNAGLLRVSGIDAPHAPWLVFINPDVARAPRRRMTMKLSVDGGMTWPRARRLLLDEGNSAGYPSLTLIDDETIGVLYEGSRAHMTFQRIPIDRLLIPPTP